jgi:phage-related tail fiber protein
LPDLRGEFIRGWDNGRGVDAGRAIRTWQTDEIKIHAHSTGLTGGGAGASYSAHINGAGSGVTLFTGGAETRPRNVAWLPCIRY